MAWTYFDYVTEWEHASGAPSETERWYERQDIATQAAFRAALDLLRVRPRWKTPSFKECKGPHRGLSEIRFFTGERKKPTYRRFRLPGDRRVEPSHFVIFLGCEKYDEHTDPEDAFDRAREMKALLDSGKARLRER